MKEEIMYDQNSILIVSILFLFILAAYEISFRIGRFNQQRADSELKSQTNAIQAGILGLLALLLGFTFNMALNRYDERSQVVIKEANAISTALLRTNLLPQPYDSITSSLLHKYVDLRLDINSLDLTLTEDRARINAETDVLQHAIWSNAVKAAHKDPRPVTTGFFINSLNQVIDARSERNAALQRHVPEPILFLLFAIFIIAGALIGYSSGLGQKRAVIPTLIFTILIALVVFIIIDLDRPVRGVIKVNQDSMLDMKRS